MKRRIACMVMAVMLVISLLPLGAIPAQAASSLTYSENVVSFIKSYEGFYSSAYWDGSRWSIGYGTAATSSTQTIDATTADSYLRTELNTINAKLNEFTANHNLVLTQNRHDALISFSYNCGTSWMTDGGRFYNAVVNQNTDVSTFLFAICLWANNGSTPDANLLNRRLAEANMYLNGSYGSNAYYTYVIFDPNGGTAGTNGEDKMQGYSLTYSSVSILAADPTRSGYSFGGWFTSATGGTGVKALSSSTSKATLYAQWGTPVSVTSTYGATLYSGAGTGYTQTGTATAGTQLVIVETTTVNNLQWGRCIDGWIDLSNTNYVSGASVVNTNSTTTTTTTAVATGTVSCTTGVNIRSGAGTGYSIVGSAYNGQTVSIYETVSVNGTFWGRIGTNQWICLDYVKLNSSTSGTTTTTGTSSVVWEGTGTVITTYQLGTVTASALNVRSGAGTGYSKVGTLTKGTQVKIYSQTTVNGVLWGKTDSGWVCMNYITLTSTGTTSNTTSSTTTTGTVIATGTVNSNTNLSVRTGAGTSYTRLGYIVGGTTINIYETATVNGVQWGRIGTNQWVCLAYVTLTSSTGTTTTTTATTGTGTVTSSTNLRIRSGAGTNYTTVGYLTPGSTVTVYEVTTNGTQQWGRIGTNQWVCMTYISMTSSSTGTTTTTTSSGYLTGVVTASQLRVRAAAGTSSAIVGYVTSGSTVTIYETTTVDGVSWGRISSGWICLSYVTLTGTSSSSSSVVWQ